MQSNPSAGLQPRSGALVPRSFLLLLVRHLLLEAMHLFLVAYCRSAKQALLKCFLVECPIKPFLILNEGSEGFSDIMYLL